MGGELLVMPLEVVAPMLEDGTVLVSQLKYNALSHSGGWTMRRWIAGLLLTMSALAASAAKKDTGTTTLKDVHPAAITNAKDQKKQQYDFIFEASGHHYTCRTSPKTSVKATSAVGNRLMGHLTAALH